MTVGPHEGTTMTENRSGTKEGGRDLLTSKDTLEKLPSRKEFRDVLRGKGENNLLTSDETLEKLPSREEFRDLLRD